MRMQPVRTNAAVGSRVYQETTPRWMTLLDQTVAVSQDMALIVHAGFQPRPFPKVIWFMCIRCRRDLPLYALDSKLCVGSALFCARFDCAVDAPAFIGYGFE